MEYNKKIIYATVLLLFSLISLHAQNTLSVKERSGTQTPYTLSGIRMLTFSLGNINFNKKDGNSNTYALANVRYLNFVNTTSIDEIESDRTSNLILYPNPVINQLHVQFVTTTIEKVKFEIIDIQGRIILQQNFESETGTNQITIPVAHIQRGLYLCRLLNGNEIQSAKFLKH